MPVYPDAASFYDVMEALFEQLMARSETLTMLANSPMVVCLQVSEPEAILTLDSRASPPGYIFGSTAEPVDIQLQMTADTLHRIWMDDVRLLTAFMAGEVQVTGDVFKAMHLTGLFRQVEVLYPKVLREKGYLD